MEQELKPDERILIGKWEFRDSMIFADDTSTRIEFLVTKYLIKITEDETGWTKLFQDPNDQRYWELSYPDSESHGAGAPQLKFLSKEEVNMKYPDNI